MKTITIEKPRLVYNVKPTIKQRKAVENIVDNNGQFGKSMIQAGYTELTASRPKNLTESKGFQELCEELGLTDSLLTKALVSDIKSKKRNRKAEIELGYKVLGRLNTEQQGNTFNTIILNTEQQQRIAERLLKGKA